MTEPARDDEVRLAPDEEREAATYHRDFHSRLMAQARHLRAGRWNALDRDNLAEEIQSTAARGQRDGSGGRPLPGGLPLFLERARFA